MIESKDLTVNNVLERAVNLYASANCPLVPNACTQSPKQEVGNSRLFVENVVVIDVEPPPGLLFATAPNCMIRPPGR